MTRKSWSTIAVAALVVGTHSAWAGEDVSLTVSASTAEELRGQLPSTTASLLAVLGLEGAATVEEILPVPMRDGVHLAATVIQPSGVEHAARRSAILIRTPYRPTSEVSEPLAKLLLPVLVKRGYVIVIVNDRGTQWSEGSYHWLKGANQDGYDTLSWVAAQPWSNGKVGTFGCSSSGESQPGLATLNHPAHKAMVAMAASTAAGRIPNYADQGIFYHGGVPDLAWTWWYRSYGHQAHPVLPAGLSQADRVRVATAYSPEPIYGPLDFEPFASHLPSADILRAVNAPPAEWDRLIRLTPASQDWAEYDFIRNGDRTKVPGLHIDSWFDVIEAYPTTRLYSALATTSPNQYLVMGPTAHCRMGTETADTHVGDLDVGDGRFDYVGLVTRWYDRWLKDDTSAWQSVPPIQYYLLHTSEWRSAAAWPVEGGTPQRLYLHSRGRANGLTGDGTLDTQAPLASEPTDSFTYDPLHPVPSMGGSCCSERVSRDQSAIEMREDVLVYSTPPYPKPVQIVGDVSIDLALDSSARDTDLTVKLVEVYPDGKAYNLGDTAQRVRYRDGYAHPQLMQAGAVYRVPIRGLVTSVQLAAGHRLRIEISSSNFPNYERNLNTGGDNYNETVATTAVNRIHHDAANPSYVEINLLPH